MVFFSQELAKLIPKIGSFSLQAKILKIIIGHHNAPHEYIPILFKPLIDDSRHGIFKRFESYNKLSDRQKHTIMYRDLQNELNRSGNKIFSKVIRYMYFDGKPVELYPVSRLNLFFSLSLLNTLTFFFSQYFLFLVMQNLFISSSIILQRLLRRFPNISSLFFPETRGIF